MRCKLSEIALVSAGQGAPQGDSNYCESGTPFVKAGNLQELSNGASIDAIQKVSNEVAATHGLKLQRKGSVLFAKSGMSCLKGYVYVLPEDAYIVSHLACVTPMGVDSDYLCYYFRFHRPNKLVKDAAYPSISLADIGCLEIEIPEGNEVAQIVDALKRVEFIINLHCQQLTALDTLIKARFVGMFGNPVLNDKGWKTNTVKEITTKIGSGATPKGGKESYREEGISLIRSMNVHNGYFEYRELAHISDEQADKLSNVIIEEEDVLLNITGASVARSCVVPDDVLPARVNQHVCIIRCKHDIVPQFMNCILTDENYQKLLWEIAGSGATREAITKQQVEGLKIIMPPMDLQEHFAAFVTQIDKSKAVVQAAHVIARNLRSRRKQKCRILDF